LPSTGFRTSRVTSTRIRTVTVQQSTSIQGSSASVSAFWGGGANWTLPYVTGSRPALTPVSTRTVTPPQGTSAISSNPSEDG
jgi:hypothetical protein